MKSVEFCYWLQGFFEITGAGAVAIQPGLTAAQTEIIKKHLDMVFIHEIDPSYPSEQKEALDAVHSSFNPGQGMRC